MKASTKLLILFLCALNFNAAAEEGKYYVGLSAGVSNGYIPFDGELPSGRYGSAGVYSFSLGRQVNERIAFDVELSHRGDFTNNDDSYDNKEGIKKVGVSISSLSAMLNGYYYYYNNFPSFKPYITGGAGLARNKTSNLISSQNVQDITFTTVTEAGSTTSFAWKLGTGVKYELDKSFEVDLRYQFVNLGDVKMSNSATSYANEKFLYSEQIPFSASRLRTHELLVGIIYKF